MLTCKKSSNVGCRRNRSFLASRMAPIMPTRKLSNGDKNTNTNTNTSQGFKKTKYTATSHLVLCHEANRKIQNTKNTNTNTKNTNTNTNKQEDKNMHPAHNQSCGRGQKERSQRRVFPEAASRPVSSCTWWWSVLLR